MNTIFFVWIFYIAYFYQNLTNMNWTRTQVAIAGRNISRAGSNINALAYLIELDIANHYFWIQIHSLPKENLYTKHLLQF